MGYSMIKLPPQQISWKKKNKKWGQQHLDWAEGRAFFNYNPVRKSVIHKKINYDLLNGILHMKDMVKVVNPEGITANFIPDKIQHYPIINSKLNVLKGEEGKRIFDFKVVVTNPNSISQIEDNKKQEVLQELQKWIQDESMDDQQAQASLEKMNKFFTYEWQDLRELRANELLNHYNKEYNMPLMFNQGFMDAATVGEEIYQCSIVGGEPVVRRINPLKIRVFMAGYSNRIEDADMIILEDYWSPGKVLDTFYEELNGNKEYLKYLEEQNFTGDSGTDSMDNIDPRYGLINASMITDQFEESELFSSPDDVDASLLPFDTAGNVRVIQMYWKSKRKIKEVKSYNPITGDEEYDFYSEEYVIDEDKGEEEKIFWVNEAWEGTKIGDKIYVNIRPCPIQYNRLSNPSICHFGIIGSIYNLNETKPFSMVDMMKPYSYFYDVIHDRLNKLLARSYGTLLQMDLAKIPKGWDMEKWFYYAKTMGIAVVDSFKEGNAGAAMGKLAGALNNASSGVIPTTDGNQIQQYVQLLDYIKNEMSEVVGITRQREGQISNRETVGGVERSTMQSTHITEWIFTVHDDLKKRVYECFLETAKIAMRGRNKKFKYITSDYASKMIEIDGDQFAESDYGLVVDSGNAMQQLNQNITTLAQAALQNQAISFSTMLKMYGTASLAEKQKFVEQSEEEMKQQQQQAQEQQAQMAQQQQEMQMQMAQQQQEFQMQMKQMEFEHQNLINMRDNETRITVAEISATSWDNTNDEKNGTNDAEEKARKRDELQEKARQFDKKLELERDKLGLERSKAQATLDFNREKLRVDAALKQKQINKKPTSSSSSKK